MLVLKQKTSKTHPCIGLDVYPHPSAFANQLTTQSMLVKCYGRQWSMRAMRTTGYVLLGICGLFLVIAALSPNVPFNSRGQNERCAVANLWTIHSAQELYKEHSGKFAPGLNTLVENNYVSPGYLKPIAGYQLEMRLVSPDEWEAKAEPAIPRESGIMYFFISSTDGEIHVNNYEPANINSFSLATQTGKIKPMSPIDRLSAEHQCAAWFLVSLPVGGAGILLFLLSALIGRLRRSQTEES